MDDKPASLNAEARAARTLYRCPRCDEDQISEEEPERCPVCSFHGLPDGRWIMKLIP